MCFFPIPIRQLNSPASLAGMFEYECGVCPECLNKKTRRNVLRDYAEAQMHSENCMITLTYDSYIRDRSGNIVGERVSPLSVCRADVQKFLKRLRIYLQRTYGKDKLIKYRYTAEYGKRTHRAHYHVLIFGFDFPDSVPYKKSKRGNKIYQSALLNKLWKHGICTVDCRNLSPANSRYVSKYLIKDNFRADGTFSACSHNLGLDWLLKNFNGKSYLIDGKEYPIPSKIFDEYLWQRFDNVYHLDMHNLSIKYVNYIKGLGSAENKAYFDNQFKNRLFRHLKKREQIYIDYLEYWNNKVNLIKKLSVLERLTSLDDSKYHEYKLKSFDVLSRRLRGIPACDSRSKRKWYCATPSGYQLTDICAYLSRPISANDTKPTRKLLSYVFTCQNGKKDIAYYEEVETFSKKLFQKQLTFLKS